MTFLRSLGYSTCTAESAERALDRFEDTHIDLVLTDLQLPGVNGIALARAAKKRKPEIPVVLISGYLSEQIQQDANEARIDVLFRKPTDLAMLEKKLAHLIGHGEPV
jgi:CheY-like chemotaxis protein